MQIAVKREGFSADIYHKIGIAVRSVGKEVAQTLTLVDRLHGRGVRHLESGVEAGCFTPYNDNQINLI